MAIRGQYQLDDVTRRALLSIETRLKALEDEQAAQRVEIDDHETRITTLEP